MKKQTRIRVYVERARRIRIHRAWAPVGRAALLCRFSPDELIVLNTQLTLFATIKAFVGAIYFTLRDRPRTAALESDGTYWSSDPRLAWLPNNPIKRTVSRGSAPSL